VIRRNTAVGSSLQDNVFLARPAIFTGGYPQ
jgi:hypothetical protein